MPIPLRRSVNGLHSNAVDSEVLEHVSKMIPGWNFDVRGDQSTAIQIHLWKDGHDVTKYVHPFDYVNNPDPWARLHPALAAITDGIQNILVNLGK